MREERGNETDPTERGSNFSEQDQTEAPAGTHSSDSGGEEAPVSEIKSENNQGEQKQESSVQEQLAAAKKQLAEGDVKIAELKTLLQVKESNQEELLARLQRLQADFDNFRRRTQREKEEIVETASISLVEQLLPVLDNFDRAGATEAGDEAAFREGMTMIVNQLKSVLGEAGLEPCHAVGCPFDPNLHHAVLMVNDDSYEDNTVVEELQKGYLFSGKVIRPAMVKVSCKQ